MLRQAAAFALVAIVSGSPAAGTMCELLCDEHAASAGTSPCHPESTDADRLTASRYCDHASVGMKPAVPSANVLISSDSFLSPVAAYVFAGGHPGPRAGVAQTGPPGRYGTTAGIVIVLRI